MYSTTLGIQPIFRDNCKWNITFNNCIKKLKYLKNGICLTVVGENQFWEFLQSSLNCAVQWGMQRSWRWGRGAGWQRRRKKQHLRDSGQGWGTQQCGIPRGVTSNWSPKNELESEWWRVGVRSLPGRGNLMCEVPQTRENRSCGGTKEWVTGEAGRSAQVWYQRLSNPRLPLWS